MHQALDLHPGLELIYEADGTWSRQDGAERMHKAFVMTSDIQAIIAGNDMMTLGALDVLSSAGLAKQILVTGCDAQSDALRAIHSGTMLATIQPDPANLGRIALEQEQLQQKIIDAQHAMLHTAVENLRSCIAPADQACLYV